MRTSELTTFITKHFRPDIKGATLDDGHIKRFALSWNRESISLPTIYANAICFGPKKDNVLIHLEHSVEKKDNILVWYYEDIHCRWTYISNYKENYFLYKKNEFEQFIVKPYCLYIRGCYIHPETNYWHMLGDFFNFVNMWEGLVLCSPNKQLPNESKLYQLNNSLKSATKDNSNISIGKSFVIKGLKQFHLLKENENYIVKSLSGIRSIVVDNHSYKSWNLSSLENLPVLFQEKVEGHDLRVHIINQKVFGKLSLMKDNVDYRYDKHFFNLQDVDALDEDLVHFCLNVALEEENQPLGIDFIKTPSGYVVLEANPSPGWSAYHPCNGIDIEPFIHELLRLMKNDSI